MVAAQRLPVRGLAAVLLAVRLVMTARAIVVEIGEEIVGRYRLSVVAAGLPGQLRYLAPLWWSLLWMRLPPPPWSPMLPELLSLSLSLLPPSLPPMSSRPPWQRQSPACVGPAEALAPVPSEAAAGVAAVCRCRRSLSTAMLALVVSKGE